MSPNVFLYRRGCKLCYEALMEVAPIMARLGLPLVVHTMQGEYIKQIEYVPALVLRTTAFNTDQEIVIMGRDMVQQVRVLELATLNAADE